MTRLRPILMTAVPAVIGGAVSSAVFAQATAPAAEPAASWTSRTITVSGSGHAEMAPDIAVLSLGVTSDGATAREALDKNNGAMGAVIDGLKELGFGVTDMQTTGLAERPVRLQHPAGAPHRLPGGQRRHAKGEGHQPPR